MPTGKTGMSVAKNAGNRLICMSIIFLTCAISIRGGR